MKLLKLLIICILLPITFSGCTAYQQRFGGKEHNYEAARPQSAVELPKTAAPKSKRFAVPDVHGDWQNMTNDINPPED